MNGAPVLMVDNFNFEPQPVLYSQAVLHVTKTDENEADFRHRRLHRYVQHSPHGEPLPVDARGKRRHLDAIHPFPPMPALE